MKNNDDYETPIEMLNKINPFLKKDMVIWDPFYCTGLVQKNWEQLGRNIIHEDKDFFTYEPDNYDSIVTNPPYSIFKKIIHRLLTIEKPFACLVPVDKLGCKYMSGLDVQIIFVGQPKFISETQKFAEHAPFKACWLCHKMDLPKDIIMAQ